MRGGWVGEWSGGVGGRLFVLRFGSPFVCVCVCVWLFVCLVVLKYTFPPLSPWMTTATLVAQAYFERPQETGLW